MTEVISNLQDRFSPLPWHKDLWQTFNDCIDTQRLPHAIIVNALEGVGAEHLAHALAYRMLCSQVDKGVACGQCSGCLTLKAGSHPDFYRLSPEENSKYIRVDQIRALCESVVKTSQQGGWKVAIIYPAEAMNIAASNALLKSLEEPEPNTLIILVSSRLSAIPMTIRSRCQIESLGIPSAAIAQQWLSERLEDKQVNISELLDMANGQPLLALDYATGSGFENRQQVESLLDAMRNSDETPFAAAQACQKYTPEDLIAWILSYVHRLMVGELQNNLNPALFVFLDKLIKAREWLLSGSPLNTQLLWEELFIEWVQIFQARK
ncbi:MAG: DNA polymerase III subunit delta' [Porticoccaceae bacterium]|nr:DNA polymerase III subunit delta' [Porticoccaceae bacterium]